MASSVKNTHGPTVLTRGRPANLGSVTAAGDVVQFSVPEPSEHWRGILNIQCTGGSTPTFALEASIDGGATWFVWPATQTTGFVNLFALTGQPGSDTAAAFAAAYNVSGLGAGATFKFGRTDSNGTAAVVWALIG